MSAFLASLADSYHEVADRKALLVLLVLSSILILFCLSVSFDSDPAGDSLARMARGMQSFEHRSPFGGGSSVHHGTSIDVLESRPVRADDGFGSALAGASLVRVGFGSEPDLDGLVRAWRRFQRRHGFGAEAVPPSEAEVEETDRVGFLEERLRRMGYDPVVARRVEGARPIYDVAVGAEQPEQIPGTHRISLFFGLVEAPLRQVSVAEVVLSIQSQLAGTFAGFIGILVALIVTASFVPEMMREGRIDLVLARPIGRVRLLLFKYLGGLLFVFLLGAFLFVGSAVALGISTGFFNPWFIACTLTLTAKFAILYAVSVLVAVLTRSTTLSALVAVGVWGFSWVVTTMRHVSESAGADFGEGFASVVRTVYAVVPKTSDMEHLNSYFLAKSQISDESLARLGLTFLEEIDWGFVWWTSALFTAVCLALAVWRFRRRDL